MPPQRWHHGAGGQQRVIQKNKDRKVAKYKIYKQYQRALRETSEAVTPVEPPSTEPSSAPDEVSTGPSPKGKKVARKNKSAAVAARQKWEREQVNVLAEKEAVMKAKEARRQDLDAAHKRRVE